jgi:syntaxin 8
MPSIKDINTSITKGNIYVEELGLVLEERHRMITVLQLTPSSNDNYEVITRLQRLFKQLNYLQSDIHNLVTRGQDLTHETDLFYDLVAKYRRCMDQLEKDATIDVAEYIFVSKDKEELLAKPMKKEHAKSVSFKDDVDAQDSLDRDPRQDLMGTVPYEPYLDNPQEALQDQSNHQIFAQHQQQLLEQDGHLDVLSQSIRTQHRMGLTMNSELDDHMIILNDLEQGVDNSQFRIDNARHKLADFRRRAQENGSLVTIVVLTVILILLLVVLN